MTGEELVVIESGTIAPLENPAAFVAGYVKVANTLSGVVREKQLFKRIGTKDHVLVEGWTLLGSMLGVFPVTVWSRPIETNDTTGWEARVEARTRDGQIVGAAEAECLRSETTWRSRDDYALRSMAQTRATSKALRQPLGFVMTLAGFNATPAEEIPAQTTPDTRVISTAQRTRLFAIAGENSVTPARIKEIVLDLTNQESTKEIRLDQYDEIIAAIQADDDIPFG